MNVFNVFMFIIFINHINAHNCAFDEFHKNIPLQPKRTSNLTYNYFIPDLLGTNTKRQLMESPYQKIRIVPYWNYLENVLIDRPEDAKFIKELVSAAIRYISQFIYVIPVINNLTIPHFCEPNKWAPFGCLQFVDYNHYCYHDIFSIPEEHLDRATLYNIDGSINDTLGGNGISNADFILYVSADTDPYCTSNTVGWATYCVHDQYGRPIAGFIHICDYAMQLKDWNEDMDVVLHEIFHTIIMSPYLWARFIHNTFSPHLQNFIPYTQVFENGYIKTSKVKQLAQKHYDCNTLQGLPHDGGHWKANPLAFELMIGTNYDGLAYVSEFLFALMEDSGHYMVDYEYAMPYSWGKKQGCMFVMDDMSCFDKISHMSNYPKYFCDQYDKPIGFQFDGCSFDNIAMANCDIYRYANDYIPDEYKWFEDDDTQDIGGHSGYNFCPVRIPQKQINLKPNWRGYCFDDRGYQFFNDENTIYDIKYGNKSKCIQSENIMNNKRFGACFNIECVDYNIEINQWNGIYVIMNGINDIYCHRNDINQWKLSLNDPISILCPDIDNICVGDKPLECIHGHWSNMYNKCICHIGYKGNQCSVLDVEIIPNLGIYQDEITLIPTINPSVYPTINPTDIPSINPPSLMPTNRPIRPPPTNRPTRRIKTPRPTRRIKQ
eukprot:490353_1